MYKFVGQVSHKHVSISIGGPFNSIYFYNTWGHVSIGEVSISQKSAEVFRGRSLVGASRGVLGLAGAATLHHHVVLGGKGGIFRGGKGRHLTYSHAGTMLGHWLTERLARHNGGTILKTPLNPSIR